jgi:hypothetical protein
MRDFNQTAIYTSFTTLLLEFFLLKVVEEDYNAN